MTSRPRFPVTIESVEDPAVEVQPRRFVHYIVPSSYMSPALKAGDIVEIDTLVTAVHHDAMYLIEFDVGEPALRRIQLLPGRRASVWTDQCEEFREEVDLSVIRVIGLATRAMCGRRF